MTYCRYLVEIFMIIIVACGKSGVLRVDALRNYLWMLLGSDGGFLDTGG